MRTCGALLCVLLILAGCRGGDDDGAAPARNRTPTPSATSPSTEPTEASTEPTSAPTAPTPTTPTTTTRTPTPRRARFDAEAAMATVRHLADEIGPREATSRAYARAATYVEQQLADYGYEVTRQPVEVPAGNSWGIDVPAGTSDNLIVKTPGFRRDNRHLVVGAHLDTVPQAPGAEDNASGVAALLELARMATIEEPPTPVVFIAFAAEEPRGDGDDLHHFGSRHYVENLSAVERGAIVGMVSLDRVGAGSGIRIRNGGTGTLTVVEDLLAAADRLGVDDVDREDNTASDHWSFEKADVPAARLGGNAFAGYHSEADQPDQVRSDTLGLNGRIAWAWLTSVS